MNERYVHGHAPGEQERLRAQASVLEDLIHDRTRYAEGERVLEAGCGVGAQTLALARRSPVARFVAVDLSPTAVEAARARVEAAGLRNVEVLQADVGALPFAAQSFDHVFVCFVLEHLPEPARTLRSLAGLLRPGGSLTVVEGDHGTTLCHPRSDAALEVVQAQVELQRRAGGDALIGRRLVPLLAEAGLGGIEAWPLYVHAHAARPDLVAGFTVRTFIAMMAGVREAALAAGVIDARRFDEGLLGLQRTTEPDGSFGYGFFKAVGRRPGPAS